MAGALLVVGAATVPIALGQWLVLRTGIAGEHHLPRLWHRLIVRVVGLRVHVHGRPAESRPLLIVSNHVSWTDIMVLGSLAPMHFIARGDMARWPVMGMLAKLQRTVFVERERRRLSGAQVDEIGARLADGDPMVLFAEGTTGDGNRLLPFKSTLFAAVQAAFTGARDGTVSVQPAAIAYTRIGGLPTDRRERTGLSWIGDSSLLPHLRDLLARGAIDVEVRFGEPLTFTAEAGRKEIAREAEARVRRLRLAILRPETAQDQFEPESSVF